MAVTKIKGIKSTLKKAIDYIIDKNKTDHSVLVSSHGVAPETADIEFEMTAEIAKGFVGDRGKDSRILAYHTIQSFAIDDEITPEKAHAIGEELARDLLQDKHDYVLSTHVDKGHIHNHLIFNSVSNEDYKKFRCTSKTFEKVRAISDKICAENGLSVIENPKEKNGKSYHEWEQNNKGTSWKARLKETIDLVVNEAKDFEEFLRIMQEKEYEIKRGKHISFKHKDQERFTRLRSLGEDYAEENIVKRIAEKMKVINQEVSYPQRIDRAGKSRYANQMDELRKIAATVSYIQMHDINSHEELADRIGDIENKVNEVNSNMKSLENKMQQYKEIITLLEAYNEHKPIAEQYQKAIIKKTFYAKHESELRRFELAQSKLEQLKINPNIDIDKVKNKYVEMQNSKADLYEEFKKERNRLNEIRRVEMNVNEVMHTDLRREEKARDKKEKAR